MSKLQRQAGSRLEACPTQTAEEWTRMFGNRFILFQFTVLAGALTFVSCAQQIFLEA